MSTRFTSRFTFRSCLLEEISFVSSPVHFLSSSFVILCVRPHRNKTTAAILQKTFLDWTNSSITCSNQSTTQQQQTQQKSKNKLTRQTRGRTNRGPCKEPWGPHILDFWTKWHGIVQQDHQATLSYIHSMPWHVNVRKVHVTLELTWMSRYRTLHTYKVTSWRLLGVICFLRRIYRKKIKWRQGN